MSDTALWFHTADCRIHQSGKHFPLHARAEQRFSGVHCNKPPLIMLTHPYFCIRDGLAVNDQDLQYGRSDQQPQPAYDRSYRYTEGSYRPPGSSEYSMPGRGQDRYVDPRAGDYGSRRDFDQGAAHSRDSRGSQYSQRDSDTQYTPRFGSRGPPPRGPSNEASARTYEDPRWSRGVDGPSVRGNRSPSHAERPPSYAERPPSYAGRPPSYADRPRAPLAERPSRYEQPAYRPVPVVEYTPIIDEALFPPPPPSSRGGRGGNLTGPADGGTPKDLEREAFNAELDRLAADLDKVLTCLCH